MTGNIIKRYYSKTKSFLDIFLSYLDMDVIYYDVDRRFNSNFLEFFEVDYYSKPQEKYGLYDCGRIHFCYKCIK
jgi:hypothetical protein